MSNKKSSTATDDEKEKATNLYNALVYDQKCIFYATGRVTKTLIKKAKNSLHKKDILFVNIYNGLENKKFLPEKLPLNSPFVENKKNIHTTLYSFHRPVEVLQSDIAYISFLARSAVDSKLCLLFAHLFTSKIYTYPTKKGNLLAKKKELFEKDKEKKGWAK